MTEVIIMLPDYKPNSEIIKIITYLDAKCAETIPNELGTLRNSIEYRH